MLIPLTPILQMRTDPCHYSLPISECELGSVHDPFHSLSMVVATSEFIYAFALIPSREDLKRYYDAVLPCLRNGCFKRLSSHFGIFNKVEGNSSI